MSVPKSCPRSLRERKGRSLASDAAPAPVPLMQDLIPQATARCAALPGAAYFPPAEFPSRI